MANQEEKTARQSFIDKGEMVNDSVSIPVISEKALVEKKVIETGKVRIVKKVKEENELVDVPLIHDEVDIKRIPLNHYVETLPEPVRYEGDTMIIPVLKEVTVVRVMLVEEIHITKKSVQSLETQNVSLRREDVTVEHTRAGAVINP